MVDHMFGKFLIRLYINRQGNQIYINLIPEHNQYHNLNIKGLKIHLEHMQNNL